jgi:hypothetical protein
LIGFASGSVVVNFRIVGSQSGISAQDLADLLLSLGDTIGRFKIETLEVTSLRDFENI